MILTLHGDGATALRAAQLGPRKPVHRRRRRRHDDAGIAVAKQRPRAHSACTSNFRCLLHKTVLTALHTRQF